MLVNLVGDNANGDSGVEKGEILNSNFYIVESLSVKRHSTSTTIELSILQLPVRLTG